MRSRRNLLNAAAAADRTTINNKDRLKYASPPASDIAISTGIFTPLSLEKLLVATTANNKVNEAKCE
jgi:hypothetical protein